MVQIPRTESQLSIEPTRPRTEETGPFKDKSFDIVGRGLRNFADQYNQIRDQKEVNEATSGLTQEIANATELAEKDPNPETAYDRYSVMVDEAVKNASSRITNPLNRARYQGQAEKFGITAKQKIKSTANTLLIRQQRVDIQDQNQADLERFYTETDPYLKSQLKTIMMQRLNTAQLNLVYNPEEAEKFRESLEKDTTTGQVYHDMRIDAEETIQRLFSKNGSGEYTDYRYLTEDQRGQLKVEARNLVPAQRAAKELVTMLTHGSANQEHAQKILNRDYDINDLLEQQVRAKAGDPTAMSPDLIKAGLALLKNDKTVDSKTDPKAYVEMDLMLDDFKEKLASGKLNKKEELENIAKLRDMFASGAGGARWKPAEARAWTSAFDQLYDEAVEDQALENYKNRMRDSALGHKLSDALVEKLSGGVMRKIALAAAGASTGGNMVAPFVALGGAKTLTELAANKVLPRDMVEKLAFEADNEKNQLKMNLRKEIDLRVLYNNENYQEVVDAISAREMAKINPNNAQFKVGEKRIVKGEAVLCIGYDDDGEPLITTDFNK